MRAGGEDKKPLLSGLEKLLSESPTRVKEQVPCHCRKRSKSNMGTEL